MFLILPIVCDKVFKNPNYFGLILTYFSLRGILASLIAKFIKEPKSINKFIRVYTLISVIIIWSLSKLLIKEQFTVMIFFYGFISSLMNVHFVTMVQENALKEIRGNIFSVFNSLTNLIGPIGIISISYLIEYIEISMIFKILSIIIITFSSLLSLLIHYKFQYSLKNIEEF